MVLIIEGAEGVITAPEVVFEGAEGVITAPVVVFEGAEGIITTPVVVVFDETGGGVVINVAVAVGN